jgi:hypothetical protein
MYSYPIDLTLYDIHCPTLDWKNLKDSDNTHHPGHRTQRVRK